MVKITSGSIIAGAVVVAVAVVLVRSRNIFGGLGSAVAESLDVANDRNFINRAFNYIYTGAGVLRDPESTNLGFDIHRAQVGVTGFFDSIGQRVGGFFFKLLN